jgi:hypothetical protein
MHLNLELGFGDERDKSKRRDIVFALLIDGGMSVMKTKCKGISLLCWTIRMLASFWVWYGFFFHSWMNGDFGV